MDPTSIEHALNEAVSMLANGDDPELCAQRWPAYRQELYPLLRVAQELRSCAHESDELLRHAAEKHDAIDWTQLLSEVPQDSETRAPYATCPMSERPAPAERQSALLRGGSRARTALH